MKERILNIANILGAFIFLAITAAFYFLPNIYYGTGIKVLGLAAAVLIIFLVCTVSNNDKIKKAKNILNAVSVRRVYVITAAVLFIAQIVFVLCIRYTPVSDGKYLDIICRNAADGRDTYFSLDIYHTHYLERYSNQWGMFLLQMLLYKTVRAALGYVPKLTAPLAAVACMQLSYFLMYKLSDKIFDSNPKKLLCMAAMFFHPILFVYSCIFYTDVLSMPFVLAGRGGREETLPAFFGLDVDNGRRWFLRKGYGSDSRRRADNISVLQSKFKARTLLYRRRCDRLCRHSFRRAADNVLCRYSNLRGHTAIRLSSVALDNDGTYRQGRLRQ